MSLKITSSPFPSTSNKCYYCDHDVKFHLNGRCTRVGCYCANFKSINDVKGGDQI